MRFYGLDVLRALMMLLGIFVHTAIFYSFTETSEYKNHLGGNIFITYTQYFISSFRMETFFILCGFLSAMILQIKDQNYYLKNRYKRVFIPLISSIFFISIPFLIFLNKDLLSLKNIILHFWFLITLLILSLISTTTFFQEKIKAISLIRLTIISFSLFAISLPFTQINKYLPPLLQDINFIFIYKTLFYSIFFIIGYYIYNKLDMLKKIKTYPLLFVSILFLSISSLGFYLEVLNHYYTSTIYFKLVSLASNFLLSLSLSLLIFIFFINLKMKESKIIFFLIDSSLVVYIVHFPIIHIIGPKIDNFILNPYFSYILICLLTLIISFISYKILGLFKTTRFLFGFK